MSLLTHVMPDGSQARWTLKEIVQGKPLGHPSHAMFVHFPVAFYVGALAFDIASRAGRFREAPVAATWLIFAALAATVPTAVTGIVDWWGMVPGSHKRRVATQHMLFQLAAASIFAVDLALRWSHRDSSHAAVSWIVIGGIGVIVLFGGQWLGGKLVYQMGMRVSTARPQTNRAKVSR